MRKECRKLKHETELDALKFAEQYPNAKRAYCCPRCFKWHLTKMSGNEFSVIRSEMKQKQEQSDKRFIEKEAIYWSKKFNTEEY